VADVVDIEEAREQKADEEIAMTEEQLLEHFVFEGWGRESIAFMIDLMRRTVIAEQSLRGLDELILQARKGQMGGVIVDPALSDRIANALAVWNDNRLQWRDGKISAKHVDAGDNDKAS
jgi:hypothetical protein